MSNPAALASAEIVIMLLIKFYHYLCYLLLPGDPGAADASVQAERHRNKITHRQPKEKETRLCCRGNKGPPLNVRRGHAPYEMGARGGSLLIFFM